MTEIKNWKMKRKKLVWYVLGILCIMIISYRTKEDNQELKEYSGIPDVVNSFTVGNDYNLTVVANSEKIEDKEEFARTVVHMCIDNSFHSVKFSTDIRGFPSNLDIDVYLNCEDNEPICKIEFTTNHFIEEYDIKNNTDKFHLYLDGEEIAFY